MTTTSSSDLEDTMRADNQRGLPSAPVMFASNIVRKTSSSNLFPGDWERNSLLSDLSTDSSNDLEEDEAEPFLLSLNEDEDVEDIVLQTNPLWEKYGGGSLNAEATGPHSAAPSLSRAHEAPTSFDSNPHAITLPRKSASSPRLKSTMHTTDTHNKQQSSTSGDASTTRVGNLHGIQQLLLQLMEQDKQFRQDIVTRLLHIEHKVDSLRQNQAYLYRLMHKKKVLINTRRNTYHDVVNGPATLPDDPNFLRGASPMSIIRRAHSLFLRRTPSDVIGSPGSSTTTSPSLPSVEKIEWLSSENSSEPEVGDALGACPVCGKAMLVKELSLHISGHFHVSLEECKVCPPSDRKCVAAALPTMTSTGMDAAPHSESVGVVVGASNKKQAVAAVHSMDGGNASSSPPPPTSTGGGGGAVKRTPPINQLPLLPDDKQQGGSTSKQRRQTVDSSIGISNHTRTPAASLEADPEKNGPRTWFSRLVNTKASKNGKPGGVSDPDIL